MNWISVKDRLPEESCDVIVCCSKPKNYIRLVPYSARYMAFNVRDRDDVDSAIETEFTDVTHWMPLPEPPEE